MSMSHNEQEELKPVNPPTDKEIIAALRKELIQTQRAYLIQQSKVISMQMEMLNIEEKNLSNELM